MTVQEVQQSVNFRGAKYSQHVTPSSKVLEDSKIGPFKGAAAIIGSCPRGFSQRAADAKMPWAVSISSTRSGQDVLFQADTIVRFGCGDSD